MLHSELDSFLQSLRQQRGFDAKIYVEAKCKLLNSYMSQTGLKSIVVGVSGGIDSAVVLSLVIYASKQVGSPIKKVVGALLPYLKLKEGTTNQSEATERGRRFVTAIGSDCVLIDLTETHKTLQKAADKALAVKSSAWASGQLVSYLRTPALYYLTSLLSQQGLPSILVGTTNRDEGAYIGYFGKAADGMNDLQLISDLHKSEVYMVAKHLGNIPDEIMTAVPTGDIYDGRNDEQLIGAPYDFIELHALFKTIFSTNLNDIGYKLKFLSAEAQKQWNTLYERIETLHRENTHKYIGGSLALHLDVYPRAVLGGWTSSLSNHSNSTALASKDTSKFVNLIDLPQSLVNTHLARTKTRILTQKNCHNDSRRGNYIKGFGYCALALENVFEKEECEAMIDWLEQQPWTPAGLNGMRLDIGGIKNNLKANPSSQKDSSLDSSSEISDIGSYRISFYSETLADSIWQRISPQIQIIRKFDEYTPTDSDGKSFWRAVGINPLFRAIKYVEGGLLIPHYDSSFSESPSKKTLMSCIIYLTETNTCESETTGEAEANGATRFIVDPQRYLPLSERNFQDWTAPPSKLDILKVVLAPVGSSLIFDHRILHDSSVLVHGKKLILRTDIMFEECGLSTYEQSLYVSKPLGIPDDMFSMATRSSTSSSSNKSSKSTELSTSPSLSPPSQKNALMISKTDPLYLKHLKDPYYSSVMRMSGKWEDVLTGGFFDDQSPGPDQDPNWKPQWLHSPLNWLTTPTHKIRDALLNDDIPEDKWLAVILSTGSFSPIHNGHISMMEEAKQAVEAHGGHVIGGYLSPSHDAYVGSKLGAKAFSSRHRVKLCELAVMDSSWLMVDPWEALDIDYAVNFTDVIIHLEMFLSAHIHTHKTIHIVYVYGSDNARFGLTFIDRGKAICLLRPGSESAFERFSELDQFKVKNNVIFWKNPTVSVSSTDIRKGTKHGLLPNSVSPIYNKWFANLTANSQLSPSKLITEKSEMEVIRYLVRDEGVWAYKTWSTSQSSSIFESAWLAFKDDISKAIQSAHMNCKPVDGKKRVVIDFVSLEEQVEQLKRLKAGLSDSVSVLSLDPCLPSSHCLEVSRIFELSVGYQNPVLGHRPMSKDLIEQIRAIPAGKYLLFDDDTSTGYTIDKIHTMILNHNPNVQIASIKTLTSSQTGLHEIVDLRDFLIGSHQAGLTVRLLDNSLARAPYCLPYVSPHCRASIPVSSELNFSIAVWKANINFFENIGDYCPTIECASESFQNLMKMVGFKENTKLKEVARWHLNRLQESWKD